MDVKSKIQQYLDYYGISANKIENEAGLSNGYWRKTKSISANVVSDILGIYSDLSAEWLLRGTGSMLLSEQTPQSRQGLIQMYQDLLEVRDNKIRELEMKIIELESRNMSVG